MGCVSVDLIKRTQYDKMKQTHTKNIVFCSDRKCSWLERSILMNAQIVISVLYLLIGILMGITAFVTKKHHSPFMDFRTGYHVNDVMQSKEDWEAANQIAGNICGGFALLFLVAPLVFRWFHVGFAVSLVLLFVLSAVSVLCIVFLPVYIVKRKRP